MTPVVTSPANAASYSQGASLPSADIGAVRGSLYARAIVSFGALLADKRRRSLAIQAKAYAPTYAIKKSDVDSCLSESSRPQFSYRLLSPPRTISALRPSAPSMPSASRSATSSARS
jgi:hypothetical protein